MFGIILATNCGDTLLGPFSFIISCSFSSVWIPPIPQPIITPARSKSISSRSSFADSIASEEDTKA